MVCSLDATMPVIADADTGFGGPAMVARTVTQYARAGVAGLHIEDQVQTKRCGHLMGKQVVSREEFLTRIRAAVMARDAIPGGSDFVIIGRTDSAQVLGMEEAVIRLKLAAEAGADVCFIEGVKTADLLKSTVAALAPTPVCASGSPSMSKLTSRAKVLVNVISGGLTPSFTSQEAEAMGAKIISEFRLPQGVSSPAQRAVQFSPWYPASPRCMASALLCIRSRRPVQIFRQLGAWIPKHSSR